MLTSGKRERKVPDTETMPILTAVLEDYATARFSYRDVADRLNARGFRTRNERPFTGASIKDVLANRFYEGKVVYHKGQADEAIRDGVHEVPDDVKRLWLLCQDVKSERRLTTSGHPRGPARHFPFSRVLACHRCGQHYHGEAVKKRNKVDLRLTHERRSSKRDCDALPRSRSVESLNSQFGDRVLRHLHLDESWRRRVLVALQKEGPKPADQDMAVGLRQAIENLRKQHIWGDITDHEYRSERTALERRIKLLMSSPQPDNLPNLEKAAGFLKELRGLWTHPGVTHDGSCVDTTIDTKRVNASKWENVIRLSARFDCRVHGWYRTPLDRDELSRGSLEARVWKISGWIKGRNWYRARHRSSRQ